MCGTGIQAFYRTHNRKRVAAKQRILRQVGTFVRKQLCLMMSDFVPPNIATKLG